MSQTNQPEQEDRGLSGRQFIMMFLVGVAVCAVFFAAGYLVGYNERSSKAALTTERVTAPPVVPPTVNRSLGSTQTSAQPPATEITADNGMPTSAEPLVLEHPPRPKPSGASSKSPAVTEQTASPAPVGEGGFFIQVAASRSRPDAEKIVRVLKARGYPAFVAAPEGSSASDNLHRVQVGPYPGRDKAEKVRDQLALEGFKQPFIKH